MASAEDQSREAELQDRVRMNYAHIEALLKMRAECHERSHRARSGSSAIKANDAKATALWWGACAIRGELYEEIKDGAKRGLLPVLWARGEAVKGWFW